MKNNPVKIVLLSLIVIFAIIVIAGCFNIIPTGYVGVRATFGQISENELDPGMHLKLPFAQTITKVNTKQSDVIIQSRIWGESQEKTPVYAENITVSYKINGAKAAWICSNISSDTDDLVTPSLVASSVKSAMVQLDADHVTVRSQIEPIVLESLRVAVKEKYGEDVIEIIKVVVDQMDFEASYNEAIAAKSIARQTLETQAIENETAVAKAEADKKVAIALAEAEAESAKIAAQAEADVIKIKAEAQAEANKIVAESLTDQVLKAQFYDKWDGKLPEVMGEGTVITNIGDK